MLRQHLLRLNPAKCAFGVSSRNFLGFSVSQREIEMALGQIRAIRRMQPSMANKEKQSLIGRLVRLISLYSDRLQPFFIALKGADAKGWGLECDDAFWAIKEYIASPLSLSQLVEGEELYLYLVASTTVVSAALVRLGPDSKQILVYFISKALDYYPKSVVLYL